MRQFRLLSVNRATRKKLEQARPRLYKVAYSWCHSGDIADDLVQETLIKAIANYEKLQDKEKLSSWLFSILSNTWKDYLRKEKTTEDIDDYIFINNETPETLQEKQHITNIVQQAIAQLPLGQRQVITLVDLEGFSYAEVAEIINIPAGTVMSRLNRARKALSEQLLDLRDNKITDNVSHLRIIK